MSSTTWKPRPTTAPRMNPSTGERIRRAASSVATMAPRPLRISSSVGPAPAAPPHAPGAAAAPPPAGGGVLPGDRREQGLDGLVRGQGEAGGDEAAPDRRE